MIFDTDENGFVTIDNENKSVVVMTEERQKELLQYEEDAKYYKRESYETQKNYLGLVSCCKSDLEAVRDSLDPIRHAWLAKGLTISNNWTGDITEEDIQRIVNITGEEFDEKMSKALNALSELENRLNTSLNVIDVPASVINQVYIESGNDFENDPS